jgi:hypothetical protein
MNSRHLLIAAVIMTASHSSGSIGGPLGESRSPIETESPRAGSDREPLRLGQTDGLRVWSRLADADTLEDASPRPGVAPQGLAEIPAGVWSYATYAQKSFRLPRSNELRLGATLAEPADPVTGRPLPARIPGIAIPQSIGEALAPAHAVYPARHTEFGFGLSTSGRIDGYATWSGNAVPLADAPAARSSFYGSLLQGPPSGLEDSRSPRSRGEALSQFSSAGNAFSGIPALSLVGQLRKKGGFRFNFADSWSLNAGSRRSDYTETLTTRTHFMTVERNWENFRSSYSLQMQRVSGASSAANHVVQVAYALSPTDSIGLSFTSGREVASFGEQGILSSEVRRVGLTAQTTVARDWAFSFNAGYADHGALPTHKSLRISVRRSF